MTWKGIVGRSFSAHGFEDYCHTLHWSAWRPSFIVLHNTSVPSLAQRPQGLTHAHILALESYYRDTQKWRAGPHLFVDDRQIWAFTPLTTAGVHSPSWNAVAVGIEMLGEYETEAFDSGRGAAVRDNAVSAIATLCSVLGLPPSGLKLHKEDPKTTHKTCPGKHVDKNAVIAAVEHAVQSQGDHQVGAHG